MLAKDGKTVLVCNKGVKASQAWVVLRSKGYESYILKGGVEAWINHLNPPAQPEPTLSAKIEAFKSHVYGSKSAITNEASDTPPPVAAPPVPVKTGRKKVAGGC